MEHNVLELLVKLFLTIAVAWLLIETRLLERLVDYHRVKEGLRQSEYSLALFVVIRLIAAFVEYFFEWQTGWLSIIGSMVFFSGLAISTRAGRQKFARDWAHVTDSRDGEVFNEGIALARQTTKELTKLK